LDAGRLANRAIEEKVDSERLLTLLDGLPLAIAQAGAYLHETGVGIKKYLGFYEQQWSDLMKSDQDYSGGSVWTTWAISYQAIRDKHKDTANLLLLWSFLDHKDLWHDLFATACRESPVTASMLSSWIGEIATSEIRFSEAMRLLRNYSLVEQVAETPSYATHPVVHQWAYHSQGQHFAAELSQLAVVVVGSAVPERIYRDDIILQRRLLPHAHACSRRSRERGLDWIYEVNTHNNTKDENLEQQTTIFSTIHMIGRLFAEQRERDVAEQMYKWALRGHERLVSLHQYWSTASVVIFSDLGDLYKYQGKLDSAKEVYGWALVHYGPALGLSHSLTLSIVVSLARLYEDQGKLDDAEEMYHRALRRYNQSVGPTHLDTLTTINSLGTFYAAQGKLDEAEHMFDRALQGYEKAEAGCTHRFVLSTIYNLGDIYTVQGKLCEAEQMYKRALRGYEHTLGPIDTVTLSVADTLGDLYMQQDELGEAEQMYQRALQGYDEALGHEQAQQRASDTLANLGDIYVERGETTKAREMYVRALSGLSHSAGWEDAVYMELVAKIVALPPVSEAGSGKQTGVQAASNGSKDTVA
jgi:tetratricopeptide (TPR) repeat protein